MCSTRLYIVTVSVQHIHGIREALEDGEGISINEQNITNIRYADDTIILADSEHQLQHMIDTLDATCEQYGMAMNAKKTKTMIVDKTPQKQCEVNVKGQRLTQLKQYKYLGTTIEHTGQCKTEVAQRINQARIVFWEKANILKSDISMKTRIRIMMCYVFSVLSNGCEKEEEGDQDEHGSTILETLTRFNKIAIQGTPQMAVD